jgi:predicted GNAT superfamily acetyltransferase
MLTYRDLHTDAEMAEVERLQKVVWQMEDIAVVPDRMMQVFVHCGGHLAGAFDSTMMVGFTMALVARDGDAVRLWSHMSGVRNEYRGRGIGFALKSHQRRWALTHGYTSIGWTFDPLQRINANFNLRRLGAVGVRYYENFYGDMQDDLNRGMPSDRLEVNWLLASARVADHADGEPQPVLVETHDDHFIVSSDPTTLLPRARIPEKFTNLCYFVEVPYDLAAVRQIGDDAVVAWRSAHRQSIGQALTAGYQVVDFVNSDRRCWYVLYRVG